MEKILVGLVEDHSLFREGIKLILAAWKDVEVVFESPDGYSVYSKLKETKVVPHVMLVDVSLPASDKTEFSGREVISVLREHFPEMKIVFLSGYEDESVIAHLIELGAHGYLVKNCDPQEVYDAIYSAHTRGSYINQRALLALQKRSNLRARASNPMQVLSSREIEVLELICKQFTSEEMAEKLFISVKTVNGHRNNLLEKTGAKNAAGLVVYAIKNCLVQL